MTLYLLSWDNGESYEDNRATLLGVYRSDEERAEAIARYTKLLGRQWPFAGIWKLGEFVKQEVRLGADLVEKHPAVTV